MGATKYPMNAYGVRDALSGDTGVELVQSSSSPPQPNIASYTPECVKKLAGAQMISLVQVPSINNVVLGGEA